MSKVVFIHLFNDRSGSPKVLSQVINVFRNKNVKTELISSVHKDGFLDNVADFHRVVFYERSENKYLTLFYYIISQIYLFFICLKYWNQDVVFYCNTMMPFGAALSGKLMAKPVYFHLHETSVKPIILKKFLRWVIRMTATKIIFVSDYLKSVEAFKGIRQQVIYNSLNEEFFKICERKKVRKNRGYFNVLMICSLKKYKGIIEFFSISYLCLAEKHLKFTLVLNASEREIDVYLKKINIPDNVTIYSRQSDVSPFLNDADILLNLSRPDECVETFGLTIIEGMAYGLPVIVPPVGGPVDIVSEEKEGYIRSCYETKEITQLIITLSKNIDIYNQLSINAKRRANDFSPKAFESCIADVLV